MHQYLDLLNRVYTTGIPKGDRTGTGTRSLFGSQTRYDLSEGFPLLTTKRVHWKSILHELLWMLNGDTNVSYLNKHGVTIWDEWADDAGDLGPVYGEQWRRFGCGGPLERVDQIARVVDLILYDPDSRRMMVSAWNPVAQPGMALAPCHCLFQFYVAEGKLSCQMYQRSADIFLGVPFNIASYALLTHMIARVTNLRVGELIHTIGDLHLYNNHFEQAKTQLQRYPTALPKLVLTGEQADIFDFSHEDLCVEEYHPQKRIPAPVSV